MKKALKPLVAVAMLATVAFAANVENPLYAPAQFGFYSKTGFSFMYKQSDANLAMKAKDWEYESEHILRGYEDFGFGLTDRFILRGAFGYTHDFSIERSGPHNARLGLGYRAINQPVEAVVWDLYMDAWLGGISKMRANLVASESKYKEVNSIMPLSFKYDNYANGRWGMWFGTVVGKTFDRVTVSAFGEVQKTYGNNNNQIKIEESAKAVINGMIKASAMPKAKEAVMPIAIRQVCSQLPAAGLIVGCEETIMTNDNFKQYKDSAEALASVMANSLASGIASSYVSGLPNEFNVDTKNVWDYVAGLKTLYEINSNWSMGGGFTWRHRGENSVKALNIDVDADAINKKLDAIVPGIKITDLTDAAKITEEIAGSFKGSMEDGVEEFTLSLQGSRQFTKNLQLTLFGEYTFDTAQDKAQLGSDIRVEHGLRLNWQF
jgi:opacity protein-like surface antigen